MSTRRPLRHFRPELIYRDDSGTLIRERYRSVETALEAGQALSAYGLKVLLRHSPRSRPVRCVA